MVHRQLSHNGFPMDVRVGAWSHNPVDLKKVWVKGGISFLSDNYLQDESW